MAYSLSYAFGPVAGDIQTDANVLTRTTDCTISSADAGRVVAPATQYVVCPTNTNAAKAIIPCALSGGNSGDWVFSAYVGVSGTPSAGIGLISEAVQGGKRFVRINTSLQIEFYDSFGVQQGHTSTRTISSSGMTKVTVSAEQSLGVVGGVSLLINLWMDDIWETSFVIAGLNLTSALCWGEWLPAATNRGADLYLAHAIAQTDSDANTDPTDHTWLTRYPKHFACGGASLPPTVNGSNTAWTSDYTSVDDFPNDNTATSIVTTTNSAKETFRYTAANPTTSADTIPFVYFRCVGRNIGVKNFGLLLYRDAAGTEVTQSWTTPGGTHIGQGLARTTDPGGAAWDYTDFDHFSGTSDSATTGPPGTMTHAAAVGWGTNTLVGAVVTSGGKTLTVASNTATVITGTGGWSGGGNPGGAAYTIACSKLEFGQQSAAATTNCEVTSQPGPEIWKYDATDMLAPGRYPWSLPASSAGGGGMMF